MNNTISYLHGLKFDPKLKQSFIAKYLLNPRLVLLITLVIIGVGLYSFFNLPRTLNPEIKIPIVIVTDVLPGAGPQDVESLVTIPIEDAVSGIVGVKTVTSSSENNISATEIEFNSGVDPDKARQDVQTAVSAITTLPKDVQTPQVIKLDFANEPFWTFALTTKGDPGSLMRYAVQLKEKIKQLSSVDHVDVNGLEEQEIQIILKPDAIATYGVNPQQVSQIIGTAVKSFPAGTVSTGISAFALTINQAATSVNEIRNLQININGTVVPISQIADVYERSKPDQNPSFLLAHQNPAKRDDGGAAKNSEAKRVVKFNVFKTSSVNIDRAYADTKKLLDNEEVIKDGQFSIFTTLNSAKQINDQFGELTKDFIITILLVFLVLFIFLGIRQAVVASLAIPLTILIGFTIMNLTHLTLSFISLFSMLLALGLLVDDTIVVVSAMTAYYRTGRFTPAEAGLLVWRDFLLPILTTTITTVWAFLPLLLSTGIIGEFIKAIPIVVSSTLIASIFVALLITLPFVIILLEGQLPYRVNILLRVFAILLVVVIALSILPKGQLFPLEILFLLLFAFITFIVRETLVKEAKNWFARMRYWKLEIGNWKFKREHITNGLVHFTVISDRYHRLIERILHSSKNRRNVLIIVITFSLFSYILLPIGFVKNEFFPKSDQDFVFMTLELPAGTNVQNATVHAKNILNSLKTIPVDFVTADVGRSFSAMNGPSGGETNDILFTLVLPPKGQRKATSIDIGQKLRDQFANYTDGKIAVTESTGGPPAGSDLQIKLFGDDLTVLSTYADKIQNYLKAKTGVVNIDKTIKPGTSKLVFVPDKQKLANAGITQDQAGFWLRLFASGFSSDSVKFSNDNNQKKDITVRMDPGSQTPESISNINIPLPPGGQSGQPSTITLANLGEMQMQNNPTLITRESGKRTISVTASVIKGYSISTLNTQLEHYADSLNLPSGYSWKTGGVNEQNQESVNSILAAMLLSFVLIVVTMVVQFASFRRALIVMLVIPLSIAGVFIIFALTNTPLSFPALIGVLALFGIVVKNAILLVDKIIQNQKAHIPFIPAIADAASSRLEAIALTSVATIIGLTPITLSDPIWRGLGGAIIAGLTFSGTIMLFFVPVVYYYWFRR